MESKNFIKKWLHYVVLKSLAQLVAMYYQDIIELGWVVDLRPIVRLWDQGQ